MKASIRRTVVACLITLGGAFAIGWSANAVQAQSACIAECRNLGWGYSQCNRYCARRFGEPDFSKGSRVYGYGPIGAGSCGEFRYMKAGRCVDARTNPAR